MDFEPEWKNFLSESTRVWDFCCVIHSDSLELREKLLDLGYEVKVEKISGLIFRSQDTVTVSWGNTETMVGTKAQPHDAYQRRLLTLKHQQLRDQYLTKGKISESYPELETDEEGCYRRPEPKQTTFFSQ